MISILGYLSSEQVDVSVNRMHFYFRGFIVYYNVFLFLRGIISKLSSEVGCGEVTNPK